MRLGEVGGRGEGEVVQGEGDGEVEAVEGGFVGHDEIVFGEAEVGEVDVVFGRGEEVALLPDFGLEGGFVEELEEGDVGWVGLEVPLEENVDGAFEHEGVVYGDGADLWEPVPAGGAAARVG